MRDFMVLIQPWAVYVKERGFFIQQGGNRDAWGKAWRRVKARDIESARRKGLKMHRFEKGKRIEYQLSEMTQL